MAISPASALARLAATLLAAAAIAPSWAQESGETLYKEVCSACHATGLAKAPKFADRKAWAPLIKEGQPVLTAHAWVGVRAMPPKGGKPDLALEDFAAGVAYMARAAGGTWQSPDAEMLKKIQAEEAKRLAKLKKK